MPDDDVLEEGGLEPAEDDDVAVADAPEAPPEAPPESYTLDQIAEAFGPRWERFSSHGGLEAVRQAGSAYENATGLIRQGAHLEPQDPSVYEKIGLDPSEIQQAPAEEAPGLWGTPWQRPTTYEEVTQYAQSEDADARRLAWEAVASDSTTPDHVNRWFFNNWAQIDPAGATLYSQQALQAQQKEMADQIREELRAEVQAQYGPVRESHVTQYVDGMLARAQAEIPGFAEHKDGIAKLMQEREQRYPGYQRRFDDATMDEKISELDELTMIAAKRFAPQRKAANAQAVTDADDAKRRQVTETGRTSGAPETEAQALKRRSVEDAKRVGGRVY